MHHKVEEDFFGKTIYDFPLDRAISKKYLCEYDL